MLALDGGKPCLYHFGMGILTSYRKRAGLSQSALAELAGTSQPQIQRLEQGTRGLSKKWATKIAPHVRAIPEELMFGDQTVPIVGTVLAAIGHFSSKTDPTLGRARMPRGGTEETVAVEVRGDNTLGGAFDGWLIYYDERRDPPTPDMLGALCVIGLSAGQVVVRTLMKGRVEGHYDLFSATGGMPLTDQLVVWAARVTAVMPPWLVRIEEIVSAGPAGRSRTKKKPLKQSRKRR